MTTDSAEIPRHPVRRVSERTGLTPHALRMWERRYGVVTPGRTVGGQRLYSDADIERLRLLYLATRAGYAISRVAMLSDDAIRTLIGQEGEARGSAPAHPPPEGGRVLLDALAAIDRLDGVTFEATLRRGLAVLGIHRALDEVVVPLVREIGERWHARELNPAHEHMATAVLQRLLHGVMGDCAMGAPARPHLLVATPAGQRHELGALLVGATAAAHGWRVTYLGQDLPIGDVVSAATLARVDAVALSLVYPSDDSTLARELLELERDLPSTCHLFLGGRAATTYGAVLNPRRVETLPDLAALRARLTEIKVRGTHLK